MTSPCIVDDIPTATTDDDVNPDVTRGLRAFYGNERKAQAVLALTVTLAFLALGLLYFDPIPSLRSMSMRVVRRNNSPQSPLTENELTKIKPSDWKI